MHVTTKIILIVVCLVPAAACNVLFGPPGSEPELPPYPPELDYPPASALPYERLSEGNPDSRLINESGYYLWRIGNRWSIMMIQRKRERELLPRGPVFGGEVHIENGHIVDVRRQNMRGLRRFNITSRDIFYAVELRDVTARFDFTVSGFDFPGPEIFAYCVTFDLRIDGISDPSFIHLGSTLTRPLESPLTICVDRDGP